VRPSASQNPKRRWFGVSPLLDRITRAPWFRGARKKAAQVRSAQVRSAETARASAARLAPLIRRLITAPTRSGHGMKAVLGVLAVAVALAAPTYTALSSHNELGSTSDDEADPTLGVVGFAQVAPPDRPASATEPHKAALGTPPRAPRDEAATDDSARSSEAASRADRRVAPSSKGAAAGGKAVAEAAPKPTQPEPTAEPQPDQPTATATPTSKPTPTKNPYAAHEARFGPGNKWVRVRGMDVASHQGYVDWDYWWKQGKRFVFIKATEGTSYVNPFYKHAWDGSRKVGMLRGAYHFGRPDTSSGAAQARYFVANGGGGKGDGWTLPGVLDIEFGEAVGVATCYNRSPQELAAWIDDFVTTYEKLTGRKAIIYTNTSWWQQCVGSHRSFEDNPLWIANYDGQVGPLPPGWKRHTFWQYTDTPLDQNYFSGSYAELKQLASK
jgi:GH25 family lysozyme M1 (1,4-beta-N-acetylmuramidase)